MSDINEKTSNSLPMQSLIAEELSKYGFRLSTLETILNYEPRQGLEIASRGGFERRLKKFNTSSYPKPNLHLVPILEDNANFICVYVDGPLKGKVCEWHHEESSLEPMFRSLESLFTAIKNNPEVDDWIDLPRDYPQLTDDTFTEEDNEILNQLHQTYQSVKIYEEDFEGESNSEQNNHYFLRLQTAFSIFTITPPKRMAELVPFLNDNDMFVKEYVISTFGKHKYTPVIDKLIEIARSKQGNHAMAADSVLTRDFGVDWE